MLNIPVKLNKYNGNLCFGIDAETGGFQYVIIECLRDSQSIQYIDVLYEPQDVCLENTSAYLVAFGNTNIARYTSGGINYSYLNPGIGNINLVEDGEQGEYYGFIKDTNTLFKFNIPMSIIWQYTIPIQSSMLYAKMIYREADKAIIINDDNYVYVVRDDGTSAILINTTEISDSGTPGPIYFDTEVDILPSQVFARYRQITDIYYSSSSSSSSFSSFSSSSSSG